MVWDFACVFFHAFPPHIAIVGQCHVGENHVFIERAHAIGVGMHVGTRRDTKITCFRVDGIHLAISMWFDPSNVVADGGDFPAFKTCRRNQHREIGFAASRGESSGDVVFFTLWVGHAQNQHVLCQPTLVAAHIGCNAQCKAFFAQQSVATVARAIAPDFTCFWVVNNVFGGVARPFHIGLSSGQRRAHGVHARHKSAISAQHVVHGFAHAGHDALVHGHIGAVRQLNANVGNWTAQWAHRKWHHIHGAA